MTVEQYHSVRALIGHADQLDQFPLGLAAPGHPDADGVRNEILRVVEQQTVFRLPQVKNAKFLKVVHSS